MFFSCHRFRWKNPSTYFILTKICKVISFLSLPHWESTIRYDSVLSWKGLGHWFDTRFSAVLHDLGECWYFRVTIFFLVGSEGVYCFTLFLSIKFEKRNSFSRKRSDTWEIHGSVPPMECSKAWKYSIPSTISLRNWTFVWKRERTSKITGCVSKWDYVAASECDIC